jgi:hypothetical protein
VFDQLFLSTELVIRLNKNIFSVFNISDFRPNPGGKISPW